MRSISVSAAEREKVRWDVERLFTIPRLIQVICPNCPTSEPRIIASLSRSLVHRKHLRQLTLASWEPSYDADEERMYFERSLSKKGYRVLRREAQQHAKWLASIFHARIQTIISVQRGSKTLQRELVAPK